MRFVCMGCTRVQDTEHLVFLTENPKTVDFAGYRLAVGEKKLNYTLEEMVGGKDGKAITMLCNVCNTNTCTSPDGNEERATIEQMNKAGTNKYNCIDDIVPTF